VPYAERSVNGAGGGKCQSTEQSVDRHGTPSIASGAIRKRYGMQPQGVEQSRTGEAHQVSRHGEICARCGVPSADHGAIRGTERSVSSTGVLRGRRSDPQTAQGVKGWPPSQIGDQRWADDVECGAIHAKPRTPSVEHGAIRDRCNRKVRGPATRRRVDRKRKLEIDRKVQPEGRSKAQAGD